MSLFDDIKGMFIILGLVERPDIKDEDGIDREVDLSDEDEIITAVALRNFKNIYSPNRPFFPIINTSSWISLFVSTIASLMLITSLSATVLLVSGMALFSGFALYSGLGIALELYMSSFGLALVTAGSSLLLGASLRKVDKIITKKNCLTAAEDLLKDRKIFHQERCLIAMEKVDNATEKLMDKYELMISERQSKVRDLNEMCERVESIPDLDPARVESDLAPYRVSIKRLNEEIKSLKKQIWKIEESSAEVKARILQSQVMATVIEAGETLSNLVNGNSSNEIEGLNESSRAELALAESTVDTLNEELLTEAGLITMNGDKPSKLLK